MPRSPSGEPWDDIMRESPGDDRLDAHNTSVDEELAEEHVCAQVHLQTGRVCVLPAAHPGGCDFQRVNIPDSSREQASQ